MCLIRLKAGKMIVVAAATGQYGRIVMDRLLERAPAEQLAVAVRDPAKADDLEARGVEVRHADYDDTDRLLFISSPSIDQDRTRLVQHRNVVAAAQAAGVGMVAYTSGLGADMVDENVPILGDHHVTEKVIQE